MDRKCGQKIIGPQEGWDLSPASPEILLYPAEKPFLLIDRMGADQRFNISGIPGNVFLVINADYFDTLLSQATGNSKAGFKKAEDNRFGL